MVTKNIPILKLKNITYTTIPAILESSITYPNIIIKPIIPKLEINLIHMLTKCFDKYIVSILLNIYIIGTAKDNKPTVITLVHL